ncbi:hypothetical protein CRG98_018200 [Punica granatum]|uniref:Uncharacterized protein n=1 Tax=Punica granatum TaxID=22663 RepID=A0A2I0K142_PUNGR|nr:hypothetical protein CRG98_018200 [Punica granatum]
MVLWSLSQKPAGSIGLTVCFCNLDFPADRTGHGAGSRSDLSIRPVRSGFDNNDIKPVSVESMASENPLSVSLPGEVNGIIRPPDCYVQIYNIAKRSRQQGEAKELVMAKRQEQGKEVVGLD